ncbi:hypothetical protein LDL08_20180 [Nonomuraea glycinis]|uniref:Uncharacterized protein n=1 Tax=Nonomuraea glycinis TaxID=2047744 RepID=A0A918AC99_9ACTN|nr:hypothetical protein [Nonomuraea glycinis]MCA2178510.1 hypothetical protein [Nonomuraea glycinis]GGP14069.1 hypothetical protein GCM10012278_68380 [Nonomuraea glycinis]
MITQVHRLLYDAGSVEHADLIAACLAKLDVFRLSRQLRTLETILGEFAALRRCR